MIAFSAILGKRKPSLASDLVLNDSEPMRPASPRPPKKFHPDPFAYHEVITLEIDSLTNLGVGVGRVDGWVVFVAFALPGERVRARVFRNDKRFSEADLIEVITPSQHRAEPPCPYFGVCGGCQYQNLAYAEQLRWKQQQVGDLLKHMAKVNSEVAPIIPSPQLYGYRSKITPHFEKPRNGEIGPIGFKPYGRRGGIVDVEQCPIAMEQLNLQLVETRKAVHQQANQFKKGATLLLRQTDDEREVVTESKSVCVQKVGSIRFEFPAGEFFQNNPFILEAFSSYVATEAAQAQVPFLIDAYCGCGFFSLTAAHHFQRVLGIEISETSVNWARKNAAANGLTHAEFKAGLAEDLFVDVSFPGSKCAMIIDPPRKGCDQRFLDQVFTLKPKHVVYVSCNPATQIRDLSFFIEAGYLIKRIQPFDLFPQTRHLECVTTLALA